MFDCSIFFLIVKIAKMKSFKTLLVTVSFVSVNQISLPQTQNEQAIRLIRCQKFNLKQL